MLIAICSDSHDNLPNIDKFLTYCNDNKVKIVIHCGDWDNWEAMKRFREKFSGKIYGVLGNADYSKVSPEKILEKLQINISPKIFEGSFEKIKFAIVHHPEEANELAATNKYNFVFYGHSHTPWMKKMEKTYLVNPGTLAGVFNKATFATYDTTTKRIELHLLESLGQTRNSKI